MNIEDYRMYCLSLGDDVEEKLPFQKFKSGEGVLVFYVMGHNEIPFANTEFATIGRKINGPDKMLEIIDTYWEAQGINVKN